MRFQDFELCMTSTPIGYPTTQLRRTVYDSSNITQVRFGLSLGMMVEQNAQPVRAATGMMQQRIRSSETAYSNEYAFAPFPKSKCGFRFARSKMVCAKTEFAQANQLPRQLLANTQHK
jgi:hypothetical protein